MTCEPLPQHLCLFFSLDNVANETRSGTFRFLSFLFVLVKSTQCTCGCAMWFDVLMMQSETTGQNYTMVNQTEGHFHVNYSTRLLYWKCVFIRHSQILFAGRCCFGTRERRSWFSTKAGTVATICQSLNISMKYHEVSYSIIKYQEVSSTD